MEQTLSPELTQLLQGWSNGDPSALEAVITRTYAELRKIARGCLGVHAAGHTLQATALLHEAYLHLMDAPRVEWQDRVHFFSMMARVMRRILIDHARARGSLKRGGELRRVNLEEALVVVADRDPEILRLDEALKHLATFDSRKAQVVEMRYFGGLTAEEIASVLGISIQSVNRDWSLAKAWLAREMSKEAAGGRSAMGRN